MPIAQFLRPVSEEQLRAAYVIDTTAVKSPLNTVTNSSTRFSTQFHRRTHDGQRLLFFVGFFCGDEPVLDEDLVRWLCDNKLCIGRPRERTKVAIRVRFYIRDKFQHAGLATYLLPREESIFRMWGARELHVYAMDSGRWVWTRPRFGYQISRVDFELLQEKYKEWQRGRGAAQVVRSPDLASFPREFLLSEVESLNLYKIL